MPKSKYYPLRKGFNDLLGYYERRTDLRSTTAKNQKYYTRENGRNSDASPSPTRGESHIGPYEQHLLFDMF